MLRRWRTITNEVDREPQKLFVVRYDDGQVRRYMPEQIRQKFGAGQHGPDFTVVPGSIVQHPVRGRGILLDAETLVSETSVDSVKPMSQERFEGLRV